MALYVKKVEAIGIHGRFDINQEFEDGVNIIYGSNGAGKTTLLHILANALGGDFDRLKELQFKTITILLSDLRSLVITRALSKENVVIEATLDGNKIFPNEESILEKEQIKRLLEEELYDLDDEEMLIERKIALKKYFSRSQKHHTNPTPIVQVAYFPAFRTMIEAWVAAENKGERRVNIRRYRNNTWQEIATERAREWFGEFTPIVNFPSLVDIEGQLSFEIENARLNIWRTDQTLISDAFLKIFGSLSGTDEVKEKASKLLAEIQELFNKLEKSPLRDESKIDYQELREQIANVTKGSKIDPTAWRVLQIYKDTLQSTLDVQEESFSGIKKYLSSVNEFLSGKSIVFKQDSRRVPASRKQPIQIEFDDATFTRGLRALSSGERQITTLVYAATHMNEQEIVLVDEPEISLHVDWQRKLIKKMEEQLGERQIIACTHSPVIGADHRYEAKELSLSPTEEKFEEQIEEDEISF